MFDTSFDVPEQTAIENAADALIAYFRSGIEHRIPLTEIIQMRFHERSHEDFARIEALEKSITNSQAVARDAIRKKAKAESERNVAVKKLEAIKFLLETDRSCPDSKIIEIIEAVPE